MGLGYLQGIVTPGGVLLGVEMGYCGTRVFARGVFF